MGRVLVVQVLAAEMVAEVVEQTILVLVVMEVQVVFPEEEVVVLAVVQQMVAQGELAVMEK